MVLEIDLKPTTVKQWWHGLCCQQIFVVACYGAQTYFFPPDDPFEQSQAHLDRLLVRRYVHSWLGFSNCLQSQLHLQAIYQSHLAALGSNAEDPSLDRDVFHNGQVLENVTVNVQMEFRSQQRSQNGDRINRFGRALADQLERELLSEDDGLRMIDDDYGITGEDFPIDYSSETVNMEALLSSELPQCLIQLDLICTRWILSLEDLWFIKSSKKHLRIIPVSECEIWTGQLVNCCVVFANVFNAAQWSGI